jgi:alpha-tubulin suppressor-like RCC1 family protein
VGAGIHSISAGTFHSLVTTAEGEVFAFGDSTEGQVCALMCSVL